MEVIRKIGNETILVNIIEPNEISFQGETLNRHNITSPSLTEVEVCKILSYDTYHPLMLEWELLDKCSFKCPFCYIVGHSHFKLHRFSEMKSTIDQFIDDGLLYCTITGGESTLHPDFEEIYEYLKTQGVIVEVYTNGSLITPNLLDLFSKHKPFKIEITIYGLTDESFQFNTGSKYSAELILKNILDIKGRGLNVVCKTPLNKITLKEFDLIRDWCKANNVTHYYSTDIFNGQDGDNLQDWSVAKEISAKYDAVKIIENSTDEELENFVPTQPNIKQCFSCAVKKYGIHINSGFQLAPCSSFLAKESKFSILELGYKESLKRVRDFVEPFFGKSISGCIGCQASPFCKMCPAKAKPIKDDNGEIVDFQVPEGHCEKTQEKANLIYGEMLS